MRIISYLKSLARIRKSLYIIKGLFSFISFFILTLLLLFVLDYIFIFPRTLRFIILFFYFIILCIVSAKFFVKKLISPVDYRKTAILLDDSLKTNDCFINSWEFRNVDDLFSSSVKEEALKLKKDIKIKHWFNLFSFILTFIHLTFIISVFVILFVLFPKDIMYHFFRMITPWSGKEKILYSFDYSVSPGNAVLPAGSECNIFLLASEPLLSCRIETFTPSGEKLSGEMTRVATTSNINKYLFTFREINRDIKYSFYLVTRNKRRIFETGFYQLTVLRPPVISKFFIRYFYPPHTGVGVLEQKDSPDLEAPEKTLVKITAEANQNLLSASVFYNSKIIPAKVNRNNLSVSFLLEEEGEYGFYLKTLNNMTNPSPARYSVRLINDKIPEISFVKPGVDIVVPNDMKLNLTIKASDDFIIRRLDLCFFRQDVYSKKNFSTNRIPLLKEKNKNEIFVEKQINLEEENLSPGEIFYYFAECDDGYPQGKHIVSTPLFSVKFPSMEDFYKTVEGDFEKTFSVLKDSKNLQEEFLKRIEDINKRLQSGKEIEYSDKKNIESLINKQKELVESLRKEAEKMQETLSAINKDRSYSFEIAEKIKSIQNLIQEIADNQMLESLKEMESLLEKVSLSEEDKKKLGGVIKKEELLRRLDNTLKMLEEIKIAKKLDEFSKRADSIVEKQQNVMDNSDKEEAVEEQKENLNRLSELLKDIEKFVSEQSRKDPVTTEKLNETLENVQKDNTLENMQSVLDALQKKDFKEALNKQMKTMSGLMNLQKDLKEISKSKNKQDTEKTINVITELFFQTAGISSEWNRILKKMDTSLNFEKKEILPVFNSAIPDFEGYNSIAEQGKNLSFIFTKFKKNVKEELEKIAIVSENFYEWFDEASILMEEICVRIDKYGYRIVSDKAKYVTSILNNIMMEFLKTLDMLKEQGSQCSSQQGQEDMENLTSAQESLNKRTQKIKGQVGKDGLSPGEESLLKELAYQQEMIKETFQELTGNMEQGNMLGNAESIAKEMEEVVKKMQQGEIDEELIKKQNKILEKMLDSQKALKVKEESPERVAERPKESYIQKTPDALSEKINKQKIEDMKKELFPSEYREIIEKYLKMLEE